MENSVIEKVLRSGQQGIQLEVNSKEKIATVEEGGHSKAMATHRKKACVNSPSVAYHRTNMYFDEIKPGLCKNELLFRLIHWWEARHIKKGNLLLGLEMLLIDEQGETIKGFISPNRMPKFEQQLKAGSIYRLTKFFASENKEMYRVTDHPQTICFTDYSQFDEAEGDIPEIEEDFFRLRPFPEFEKNADKGLGLYDVIGQIKHISGNTIQQEPQLARVRADLAENEKEKFTIHLLLEKELVIVNLWDKAAIQFGEKYRASKHTPVVLLLTTVNPKNSEGRVTLTTMASSRVFIDEEIPTTKEFLTSLEASGRLAVSIKKIECKVTKLETLTLGEIQQFVENEPPQVASFETIAQVTNVVTDYGWYYISCSKCKKKLIRTANNLVCNVCKNHTAVGVLSYRVELAVKDDKNAATFVLFDRVAAELTGIHVSDYVDNYVEAQSVDSKEEEVPVPQGLLETIGKTYRFVVKVTDFNFRAMRQTLTVERILEPVQLEGNVEVDASTSKLTPVNGDKVLNNEKTFDEPSMEKPSKRSRT